MYAYISTWASYLATHIVGNMDRFRDLPEAVASSEGGLCLGAHTHTRRWKNTHAECVQRGWIEISQLALRCKERMGGRQAAFVRQTPQTCSDSRTAKTGD